MVRRAQAAAASCSVYCSFCCLGSPCPQSCCPGPARDSSNRGGPDCGLGGEELQIPWTLGPGGLPVGAVDAEAGIGDSTQALIGYPLLAFLAAAEGSLIDALQRRGDFLQPLLLGLE